MSLRDGVEVASENVLIRCHLKILHEKNARYPEMFITYDWWQHIDLA